MEEQIIVTIVAKYDTNQYPGDKGRELALELERRSNKEPTDLAVLDDIIPKDQD